MGDVSCQRLSCLIHVIAGALAVCCAGCANRLLLYPSTRPVHVAGAERRTLQHAGRTVELSVARSAGGAAAQAPQAYVLDFSGNAARAEFAALDTARQWAPRPVEVWAVNYPGFGGSTGPAELAAISGVALASYDALAQEAGQRPIFVNGTSLGSAVALSVATARPVAGLALYSPPPIPREVLAHHGWWNLWLVAIPVALQIPKELDSLATAPRVHVPAVFVISGRDSVVPVKYQRMVVDAYGGEKEVVLREYADHNTPIVGDDETRLQAALDWLWARGTNSATAD